MMESVRTWVLSILAAALLLGLLESCAPKGAVRSVAKLAAGLALFLAVAAPLEERLPDWVGRSFREELASVTAFSDTLIETDKTYLETIMSRRVAEYIVSEAEKAGAAVTCSVECGWTEEGIPIPCSAVVRGGLTAAQRAALTDYASQQLGIAEDQIRFEEDVE